MITHTTLDIEINGKALPGCISLALSQGIHGHHFFKAEFSGRAVETDPLSLAADSVKLAGTEIKIGFNNSKGESSIFKGIVTSVHSTGSHQAGFTQNVVFEGYSPTILLEHGNSSQAFTKMSLKDILGTATRGAADNLLSVYLKPRHSASIPYTVQYNETAFAFVNRLARRYGEWCYYDGLELVIGSKKQEEIKLFYGYNLQRFDFILQTSPIHQKYAAYGYLSNELLKGATKNSDTSIDGPSSVALNTSDKTWKAAEAQFLHHFQDEEPVQQQIDSLAKLNLQTAAANKIIFKGSSTCPALFPGAILIIESVNPQAPKEYGRFILTAVDHHFSEGGHYQNQFEAVPLEVEVSPRTNTNLFPHCNTMPGVVADNNDPEGLGRVQVKLYWHTTTTTPWIRVSTPYSGKDKGLFFTPEIGEEVMVGFENGNAEKPYVAGTLYHGKAKPEGWKTDKNDIKAIRTRSGHTIALNDADGKEMISISDKGGSIIRFDTKEKSLFISAPENLEISAKNVKISAEENIEIGAKEQIDIAATKDLNLLADGMLALQSMKDLTAKSKSGNVTVEATKDALLSGMNVAAEGKMKADLTGTQTTVAGKMTAVQGAAFKIDVM